MSSDSYTASFIADMFPFSTRSFQEFFAKRTGGYILTNVAYQGRKATVFLNIAGASSASWRSAERPKATPLTLTSPPFTLTSETACLSSNTLNALATHFEAIRQSFPEAAFSKTQKAAIRKLRSGSVEMTNVLNALEARSDDIRHLCESLSRSIDTPIYKMRKLKKPLQLVSDSSLSDAGKKLLASFAESVAVYDALPTLTGFGVGNDNRGKTRPNKRDALLRHFMEANRSNPLQGKLRLDFVAHELKPLNIANRLRWSCDGNPRTDSIDLLMAYQSDAVITEVKMAGDSFASVALVQLLYYAAVLSAAHQKDRLKRWFPQLGDGRPRLGIIVQERNEADEKGFHDDLKAVLTFLRLREAASVLGTHFGGAVVLVVERIGDSYRIFDGQEYSIDWSTISSSSESRQP